MKSTNLLTDLVLTDGMPVAAHGLVDLGGDGGGGRLWTVASWDVDEPRRVAGGDVVVTFEDDSLTPDQDGQLLSVTGIWRQGTISRARGQLIDTAPTPTLAQGPEPASGKLPFGDERLDVFAEASMHCDCPELGAGYMDGVQLMQVLYVTQKFADWHARLTRVRLDVFVSVTPRRRVADSV